MGDQTRQVYCIFGGRALRYARTCLLSMLQNSLDPLRLTVITDGPKDASDIADAFREQVASGAVRVFIKQDADERAREHYRGLEGVA